MATLTMSVPQLRVILHTQRITTQDITGKRKHQRMRNKVILFLLATTLIGCTGNTLVHHYQHAQPDGWGRTDTIRFNIPAMPRHATYDLTIGMRTGNAFPYQGVWIEMNISGKSPFYSAKDTIYFSTSNNAGELAGDGITLRQIEHKAKRMNLHAGQELEIQLRHLMTKEVIPQIKDIGIKLSIAANDND